MSSTCTLRTRMPWWFPDPRCRTSNRQSTPSGPTTWHYDGDKDGDRRRRTRAKTATYEHDDRLTLGTSEVAAPLQLTTSQSDEDGGGRRRRLTKTYSLWGRAKWQLSCSWRHPRVTKTKTDSLWGWAKWQLPHSWRHPRMTKRQLDTSPLMRLADSRAHEGCSSFCSPRSSRGTAPVLSFLNLLSGKR